MQRKPFAERIASGVAGWFQQLAAQDLHSLVGEDAAKVELVRMVRAQRPFTPETSQLPTNWPKGYGFSMDIAVLGLKPGPKDWYGAIELKWPGRTTIPQTCRLDIVQDAVRVTFAQTTNLNAKFIVVGGSEEAIHRLFDHKHPKGGSPEAERKAFVGLFSRAIKNPARSIKKADLFAIFPSATHRTPPVVTAKWNGGIHTELLAHCECKVGTSIKGHVYVWQCNKTAKAKP